MNTIPDLDFPVGGGPKTYRALTDALQRLLDDEPKEPIHVALREEADEDGITRPVPITQQSVAIESGNPNRRKHISGEKCTFPLLAGYIRDLRSTHGVSENTTARLDRQAGEIGELDQRVRTLRSRVLDAVAGRERAEAALLEAEEQIVRLKKRKSA